MESVRPMAHSYELHWPPLVLRNPAVAKVTGLGIGPNADPDTGISVLGVILMLA